MYCNHCGDALPGQVTTCPNCEAPTPRQDVGPIEVPQDIAERAQDFVGRSWVVETLLSWAYEEDTRYYLLTGEPGSGKTALAAWLAGAGPDPADPADARRLTLVRSLWDAAHFCVAPNQEGSLSPVTFSKQLAQQLAVVPPDEVAGPLGMALGQVGHEGGLAHAGAAGEDDKTAIRVVEQVEDLLYEPGSSDEPSGIASNHVRKLGEPGSILGHSVIACLGCPMFPLDGYRSMLDKH